jgi:hypothetical protein
MDLPTPDPALQAANLALHGRKTERAASRFASIQLRDMGASLQAERRTLGWEMAAVAAVGFAAVLGVTALWFY